MKRLIECVPNISEGRDMNIINQVVAEVEKVDGVKLLDVDPGATTNRTVITFVGEPENVCEAAFRLVAKAQELIDMRNHHGDHPRFGATDVCPLIPVANITMEEVVEYARALGKRIGTELEIPVLLGAYAGLRRGEIAALTIQDLDGDYLHISKDMVLDDYGEWITKAPKTLASNRTVLLPHYVAERIRQKGYITHLTPNNITKRFIKRQQSLGVEPHYTFHSLRHFFASYLHAQNIPDAYVLRAGGWATPHVMQKVYRHALDDVHLEYEQKAVSAFQIPFQDKYTQT